MKKLLTILFVIIFLFGMSAIDQTATAQTQEGDFKVGAGLVFGSGVGFGSLDNDLGIRVDGYYAFTPEIRGGGDFTFYFQKAKEKRMRQYGN